MNTTPELKGRITMNNQFTAVASVVRGFIVAAFIAIVMLPVVLSATAATIA